MWKSYSRTKRTNSNVRKMTEKGRQQVGKYVLVAFIIILFFLSVSILWTFLTTDYPTHSDVFFMGVECGVLVVVLLVCIFLIWLFLYRLMRLVEFGG